VSHLPHQLIEAFRSTLEEVAESDVIVHVVDGSHADPEQQVRAVHEVLGQVAADKITEILVVNKIDATSEETLLRLKRIWPGAIFVSAQTGAGLDDLRRAVETRLPRPSVELRVLVPYDRGDLVAAVHDRGEVLSADHRETGTELWVRVPEFLAGSLRTYQVRDGSLADNPL
jgi:GTP-binding protein HflX